jgi:hypothetical protein
MLIFLVFSFVCCPIMCLYVLSSVLCDVNYDFRINIIFGSSLPLVVCMRAYVFTLFVFVVSNTYCIVFSFDLSSYCFLSTQCCKFL